MIRRFLRRAPAPNPRPAGSAGDTRRGGSGQRGPEVNEGEGWLRLTVTFQDRAHAEWALWQLESDAQVVAPEWLCDAIRERADSIAAAYSPRVAGGDPPRA